jgi:branched-subunit amino acid aminotransferase/4-amino-4-deoxychorismate lyase
MTEPIVYLNGRLVPASEAHLAIYDAGVVQGATVAEQTRTFRHRPFRLGDHLDRLFRGLQHARIDIGMSPEELTRISEEVLAHNARPVDADDDLGLVQFVTAGEYATYAGLSGRPPRAGPTVCVHTYPLPFELWAAKIRTGAHLITPSVRQVPPQCWPPQMKCRSRMHYYLAEREVSQVDPEAYALLLDLDGNVTETNAANFLMLERGTLVSPPAEKTLPGISRATVVELAGRLGIPFTERDLPVARALAADEALLSSTPYCLLPVTRINGVPVGDGTRGPVFRRLLGAWSEKVGLDIEQQLLEGAGRRQAARGAAG